MNSAIRKIKPVVGRPGIPLYLLAKEALANAIRDGRYQPGDRLPSTQELSEHLSVSLVTVHRALQELNTSGILDRQQGKGTFVADRRRGETKKISLGLVLQSTASLADFYHGQILEGMNGAVREVGAEIVILQNRECASKLDGQLLLNPLPEQLEEFGRKQNHSQPTLVVGARADHLPWIDVDNHDLIRRAVEHLYQLGHRKIGYVGGAEELSNSRDRIDSFYKTCEKLKVSGVDARVLKAESWRLDEREKMRLGNMISGSERPSAIVAGGYYLALDAYQVAMIQGLSIPDDISVIGVDDPPSAEHISPALTTMRQPLAQLGYAAVSGILGMAGGLGVTRTNQVFRAELVVRQSTAPVRKA